MKKFPATTERTKESSASEDGTSLCSNSVSTTSDKNCPIVTIDCGELSFGKSQTTYSNYYMRKGLRNGNTIQSTEVQCGKKERQSRITSP